MIPTTERFPLRIEECGCGRHLSHLNACQSLHWHQLLEEFQSIAGTSSFFSFLQDTRLEKPISDWSAKIDLLLTVKFFLSLQEGILLFQQWLGNTGSHDCFCKTFSSQRRLCWKFLVCLADRLSPIKHSSAL